VGGLLTIPRLLNYLLRFDNDELLVVALLGICFGVTLIGVKLELSLALGAVLVGAVASESDAIGRLGRLTEPLRHVFSAVFFVAVGLMLDPAMLARYWAPILAVTALVIGGKFIMNTGGALLTGQDMPTAIRMGAGLAQIGEFALIICSLGVSLGAVTQESFYPVGVSVALLTTLISPFLLRGADRLARQMERDRAWKRWTHPFRLYGQLVERVTHQKSDTAVRRAVRRSIWIMIINTVLSAGALAFAAYLSRRTFAWPPFLVRHPELLPAALWLAAMVACLPLTVATLRKLQALGMILAEVALPIESASPWARSLRGFLANAILAAGSAALALLTFLLSYTMLPSGWLLLLLAAGTAVIALWRWPRLVKVYAQAQAALKQALTDEGKSDDEAAPAHVEVTVLSTALPPDAAIAGQALRDIRLRSRTGATVVAIQREGRTLTNPGPDEVLQPGDRIFLLGDASQIRKVLALVKEARK
jgi:CPA2 family monovalent cation:H+ antiporter-2